MHIVRTALSGLLLIKPVRHQDARGFFAESWSYRRLAELGINLEFCQDNHSLSKQPGTLRGLHYQAPPHAQDKLIRVGRGRLLDIAVDVRRGSPNYGKYIAIELSFENGYQLLVPKGFLHGFMTLEPETEIVYKCSDYYNAKADGAVHFASPSLGIDWGINLENALLSDKDQNAIEFSDFQSPFEYTGPLPWEES